MYSPKHTFVVLGLFIIVTGCNLSLVCSRKGYTCPLCIGSELKVLLLLSLAVKSYHCTLYCRGVCERSIVLVKQHSGIEVVLVSFHGEMFLCLPL